ncbi:MAG: RNA polymerase sigma factor [Acidimicrobiales bacterium]
MRHPREQRHRITTDMKVDLTTASDGSLAMSVARWEEDALAEIYRRYASGLLSLARRLLYDARLAEDVVQEVFVRLWNRPERFDPDRGSLRAFLAAETHGRAVDLLRAEEARRRRERTDAMKAPVAATIEHEVVETLLADDVRAAVAELPETERKAVELAYFGGLTYREVAVALNEPEGTVKSRIRKALHRLETELIDLRDREVVR